MLNGTVWIDDALVVKGTVEKFYSTKPRIEIIVKYDKSFDCEYNRKAVMKSKYFKEMMKMG